VTKTGGAPLAGVTDISAGSEHSCARTNDGAAWCWGHNDWGQLGDGTTRNRTRAVQVTKAGGGVLPGVTAVSASWNHSCARTNDGAAWCWGTNGAGELGNGTTNARYRAVQVVKAGGGVLAGVTAISADGSHSCARTSDGAAWCWGFNFYGRLGDGTTRNRTRAVQVTKAGGGALPGVTAVSAGGQHSCARTNDGGAWCWGLNYYGELGDGTTTDRRRAVRVVAPWATAP
jgi:alpha-tubulin suppressor-like RCC1 family protein